MERPTGFSTDEGRSRFAEALGRKHDRFAFPDTFNDHVLAKLRKWIVEAHGKVTSENGKAYRSIQIGRVTANPHREAPDLVATFHFILVPKDEREVTRTQIAKTLDDQPRNDRVAAWHSRHQAALHDGGDDGRRVGLEPADRLGFHFFGWKGRWRSASLTSRGRHGRPPYGIGGGSGIASPGC